MFVSEERSSVWGKSDIALPPHFAAFVNGIAVSLYENIIIYENMNIIQLWFDLSRMLAGSLHGL